MEYNIISLVVLCWLRHIFKKKYAIEWYALLFPKIANYLLSCSFQSFRYSKNEKHQMRIYFFALKITMFSKIINIFFFFSVILWKKSLLDVEKCFFAEDEKKTFHFQSKQNIFFLFIYKMPFCLNYLMKMYFFLFLFFTESQHNDVIERKLFTIDNKLKCKCFLLYVPSFPIYILWSIRRFKNLFSF